ncbi:MAG: hypothetical protein ABEK17_01130 [Candidatus Aenigmatarchaeota archaeon]
MFDVDEFYDGLVDKVEESKYPSFWTNAMTCSDPVGAICDGAYEFYRNFQTLGEEESHNEERDPISLSFKSGSPEKYWDENMSEVRATTELLASFPFILASPFTAILDGLNLWQRRRKYNDGQLENEVEG